MRAGNGPGRGAGRGRDKDIYYNKLFWNVRVTLGKPRGPERLDAAPSGGARFACAKGRFGAFRGVHRMLRDGSRDAQDRVEIATRLG